MKKYPFLEPVAKKIVVEAKKKDAVVLFSMLAYSNRLEYIQLADFLRYAHDSGVVVTSIPKKS